MMPLYPMFVSPMLTTAERQRLDAAIPGLLYAYKQNVAAPALAKLLDDLALASGRAKAGPDLPNAAEHTTVIHEFFEKKLTTPGFRRHVPRNSIPTQSANRRLQAKMPGAGRPSDTWKDVLMYDVRTALKSAGVTGGWWNSDKETLLTEAFRECAKIAGHPLTGDIRAIFRNARGIDKRP
jgi:hypothetical protein